MCYNCIILCCTCILLSLFDITYILMSLFYITCILFAKNIYLQIILGLLLIYDIFLNNNRLFSFIIILIILNVIFNIIHDLIFIK